MIDFMPPMLASPLANKDVIDHGWFAEEKLDGHRILVAIGASRRDLFGDRSVMAWSRYGNVRALPTHVREALKRWPDGLYDGELLTRGGRSYSVTEIKRSEDLVYVAFDVLVTNLEGTLRQVTALEYQMRRMFMLGLETKPGAAEIATVWPVTSREQVQKLAEEIWARDGEGLVLKRKLSPYAAGVRNRDWLKVKMVRSAEATLIGYRPGKLGPHSIMLFRDDDGNETAVKWKNYDELAKAGVQQVGRRARLEFQERTNHGSYRHPRFDHWIEDVVEDTKTKPMFEDGEI